MGFVVQKARELPERNQSFAAPDRRQFQRALQTDRGLARTALVFDALQTARVQEMPRRSSRCRTEGAVKGVQQGIQCVSLHKQKGIAVSEGRQVSIIAVVALWNIISSRSRELDGLSGGNERVLWMLQLSVTLERRPNNSLRDARYPIHARD